MKIDIKALESAIADAINHPSELLGVCLTVKEAQAVLSVLKEQEAVKPEWKGGVPFCGNCGHRLQKKNRNMVGINCPMCKRWVKWE